MALKRVSNREPSQSELVKPPILRDWLKDHPYDNGEAFQVFQAFRPAKYPNWTLVCGKDGRDKFRVNVYESNPDYNLLQATLADCKDKNVPLYLIVDDVTRAYWTLATDDELWSSWRDEPYGFACVMASKNAPKSKPQNDAIQLPPINLETNSIAIESNAHTHAQGTPPETTSQNGQKGRSKRSKTV